MHDCLELRYHTGQPGNYVGVKKQVGKRKTSYQQARMSITKRKGDTWRQYGLGTFFFMVKAAIANAKARLDTYGPPTPEGDRIPRTCALPPSALTFLCLTLLRLCCCVLAAESILDSLGIDQTREQDNSAGPQLLAQPAVPATTAGRAGSSVRGQSGPQRPHAGRRAAAAREQRGLHCPTHRGGII